MPSSRDAVKPFDTAVAIATIESELGGALGEFFRRDPRTAPSLRASSAQVYRARLAGTDTYVAVKVQRPQILSTVSKDLYVLRRAAEVYQGLIERFAPQQRTDYVALLNEWAVGFYTELDFLNEADNQQRCRDMIIEQEKVAGVYVPKVYHEHFRHAARVGVGVGGGHEAGAIAPRMRFASSSASGRSASWSSSCRLDSSTATRTRAI